MFNEATHDHLTNKNGDLINKNDDLSNKKVDFTNYSRYGKPVFFLRKWSTDDGFLSMLVGPKWNQHKKMELYDQPEWGYNGLYNFLYPPVN